MIDPVDRSPDKRFDEEGLRPNRADPLPDGDGRELRAVAHWPRTNGAFNGQLRPNVVGDASPHHQLSQDREDALAVQTTRHVDRIRHCPRIIYGWLPHGKGVS